MIFLMMSEISTLFYNFISVIKLGFNPHFVGVTTPTREKRESKKTKSIMRRKILNIVVICISILGIVVYWLIYEQNKELKSLEKQANYLIQQVEFYKKTHHKLPQSMDDMRLSLPDDCRVTYEMVNDSLSYTVGYPIAPFRDMVYYSNSKSWIPQ